MAGLIILATNPSPSEQQSAHFMAALLRPNWTVVLKDPSGGRGGNTADLAIYTGGSTNNHANDDDYENETQTQPIDIYTPARGTGGQAVAQNVATKLSNQAPGGVCVDLSYIPPGSRAPILATLNNPNQLNVPRRAVVIVHANGQQLGIIGVLPQ